MSDEKLPALYCVYDTFSKKWYAGERQTPPIHFRGECPALYIPAQAIRAIIESSTSDSVILDNIQELLTSYEGEQKP